MARILANTSTGQLDSLGFSDRMRLEFVLGAFYFGTESMLALHEKGQIDPELWQNVFENNFRLLGSPLGREYLASRRGPISRRLEALVDERVNREGTFNVSFRAVRQILVCYATILSTNNYLGRYMKSKVIRIVGGVLLLGIGVGLGYVWGHEVGWVQSRDMVCALSNARNPDVSSSLSDVCPEITTTLGR